MAKEATAALRNVPKAEAIKAAVTRVLNLYEDIASHKGTYMAECKTIKEDIKQVYKDAKAEGVDTQALKAKIEIIQLEAKITAVQDNLDGDQLSIFDIIQEAVPSNLSPQLKLAGGKDA